MALKYRLGKNLQKWKGTVDMNPNIFKTLLIPLIVIIFLSLLVLDGGESFRITLTVSLYAVSIYSIIHIRKNRNDYITGVIIALICGTAPIFFELLTMIFPPL